MKNRPDAYRPLARSLRRAAPLAILSALLAACAATDGGQPASREAVGQQTGATALLPDTTEPQPAGNRAPEAASEDTTGFLTRTVSTESATRSELLNAAFALQQVFRDVASASVPTVVQIDTNRTAANRRGFQFEQPGGTGSGVIYDRERTTYYVLTNAHVIVNNDDIRLTLHDGMEVEGVRLIGSDRTRDIAVLSFEWPQELAVATLGDSDALVVGDQVLAVGSPFGFQSSVTSGIVSAVGREQARNPWAEYVQTDASINPGNSGGALVALDGSVIGINTWIASRTGASSGIGFALPINTALSVADQLRGGGVRYGYLGIMPTDFGQPGRPAEGALVFSVVERSPADRAGLLAGDVIVAIGGRPITDRGELMRAVAEAGPGARLGLVVERDGAERDIDVRLAQRPATQDSAGTDWPGVHVTEHAGGPGVAVLTVSESSAAWRAGIRAGDLITRVDNRSVRGADAFYDALREADSARLTVSRAGSSRSRTFTATINR